MRILYTDYIIYDYHSSRFFNILLCDRDGFSKTSMGTAGGTGTIPDLYS